jgi:hypothetical protein
MKFFNWEIGRRIPNQRELGGYSSIIASRFGLGFSINEFNLFSQVKGFRTDLLNGTKWRPSDAMQANRLDYLQFIRLISKYSTAIYNDFVSKGFVIIAQIDNLYY